jgi:hypothetical protein
MRLSSMDPGRSVLISQIELPEYMKKGCIHPNEVRNNSIFTQILRKKIARACDANESLSIGKFKLCHLLHWTHGRK